MSSALRATDLRAEQLVVDLAEPVPSEPVVSVRHCPVPGRRRQVLGVPLRQRGRQPFRHPGGVGLDQPDCIRVAMALAQLGDVGDDHWSPTGEALVHGPGRAVRAGERDPDVRRLEEERHLRRRYVAHDVDGVVLLRASELAGDVGVGRPRAIRDHELGIGAAVASARDVRAAVYHLPDPALIPLALLLKLRGARVIYDAHEDRPRQALTKYRALGRPLVGIVTSLTWRTLEGASKLFVDRFIAVTPHIAARFPAARTTVVRNYPRIEEFARGRRSLPPYASRPNDVVYTGAVREFNGVEVMVEAMGLLPDDLDARLLLVGDFCRAGPGLRAELEQLPGWERVHALGPRPRVEMVEILAGAKIGLSLYGPRPEQVHAIGNKTFEYMAIGLPVVASDFPVWQEVVRDRGAGLTVDPTDPREVARAIRHLLAHPREAEAMGAAGAEAVASEFNWSSEGERLVRLYDELLERTVVREPARLERQRSAA